ncbi:ATP-grasp domain-containing protein [Streptomyces tirandamycinicus]|uniref:ATP-grasp domain-containing protein n=1 Tax=Streptomyces tirandamycinicus TaxID=2174846 RepID=UPI00226E1E34|nr:ATP-grasp domain-containing protein [Streptomyces tirandamycinicus]MCY0982107.1 ATP-grasp domain-containing protein [Streptomyces tirandamycinicus]
MTKKILLLEAWVAAGEDLLRAAAALGVEAYVATHEDVYATHYRPDLKEMISGVAFTDFGDPAAALDDLTAFCRANGVDGVVACWEFLSPVATLLAARLGLPGHDPVRAAACRNKRLMAEMFAAHDVPAPRTVTAADHHTLARRAEAAGIGFPLVVKPVENAASIGVTVVSSAEDLPAAARLAASETHKPSHGIPLDTTLLGQEYVDGDEFSVETVLTRGEVHHLAVTEKFTTRDTSRAETGHTVPAQLPPGVRAAVLTATTQAVTALGLRDGVAHTEVKVDSRGRPHVIEVGARPPGDNIMKLIAEATGIDQARAYLLTALGERPDLVPRHERAAAIRFITAPCAGTLTRAEGLPQGDHVVSTGLLKHPGDAVGDPRDNLQRIGHLMVRGDNAAAANKAASEALNAITVEVSP